MHGNRVVLHVGEHGAAAMTGSRDVGVDAAFNLEHLGAIQQSVLVARRMRKLVKHVERVEKLNDARRRSKAAAKSKADAAAAAAAVAGAENGNRSIGSDDEEGMHGVKGVTEEDEKDESFDIESTASMLAAANRSTLSEATLVLREEHSF